MRAAETELFRDKIELSLDGKQVFYLFFGGAVIASMVFVLGVMIGRRVEARAHADAHAVASASSDPLAALDKLDAQSRTGDLAFRGALRGETPVTGLGAVDAQLAPKVPPSEIAAIEAKVAEAKKEQEAKKAEEEAAKAEAKKAEAARKAQEAKKAEAARKAEAKKAEEAKQAAAPADGPKAEKKARAKFTLQLSSFRDKSEADAFVSTLRAAGANPYVKKAEVDGQEWHRVRLGKYPDYDTAIEAKKTFEAKHGKIAYVTRL
jgi:cell division septation protein DedD